MLFKFKSEIILKYLKENNLSAKEFCEKCGIRLCHYKRLITNAPNIGKLKLSVFCKLADYLKVRVEDMIIRK